MSTAPSDCPNVAPNVVLVGLMGTGKTSIGRMVAESLGLSFLDTDERIVSKAGMPIPDIFEAQGEEGFRDLESQVLDELGASRGKLIATGGGIILRECNRRLLKRLGFVIWLTASTEILAKRISQNRDRPLVQNTDPKARLAELMEIRKPLYQEVADFTVDTTELTVPETVHGLVESVHYHFACQV